MVSCVQGQVLYVQAAASKLSGEGVSAPMLARCYTALSSHVIFVCIGCSFRGACSDRAGDHAWFTTHVAEETYVGLQGIPRSAPGRVWRRAPVRYRTKAYRSPEEGAHMYLVWGTPACLYITCHYALMSRQDLVFVTHKASFLVCKTSFLVLGVTFLVCKTSLGELSGVQS